MEEIFSREQNLGLPCTAVRGISAHRATGGDTGAAAIRGAAPLPVRPVNLVSRDDNTEQQCGCCERPEQRHSARGSCLGDGDGVGAGEGRCAMSCKPYVRGVELGA